VLGRHLIELGEKPGPDFKPVIEAALEAQLDGAFADEAGGVAWLKSHLGK
jgi:tRNA nucleotidyltransferase (CCA-adding enzyme)